MPFVTRLKVRFYELDPYNHVNHASYIQYFESARVELLEAAGVSLAAFKEQGFHLVVTDLHISYRHSAGPHDELEVHTEIAELRRASSRWWQRMYRDGELIATQEVATATTTVEGRPVRFPKELAAALEPFVTSDSERGSVRSAS